MGRKQKLGIDYFPLAADFFADKNTQLLKSRLGTDGIVVYLYILCQIYHDGYYLKVDEDFFYLASAHLGLSVKKVEEVVQYLLQRRVFDQNCFATDLALTSVDVQETWLFAVKARVAKTPPKTTPFWLLDQPIALLGDGQTERQSDDLCLQNEQNSSVKKDNSSTKKGNSSVKKDNSSEKNDTKEKEKENKNKNKIDDIRKGIKCMLRAHPEYNAYADKLFFDVDNLLSQQHMQNVAKWYGQGATQLLEQIIITVLGAILDEDFEMVLDNEIVNNYTVLKTSAKSLGEVYCTVIPYLRKNPDAISNLQSYVLSSVVRKGKSMPDVVGKM